MRSLLILTFTLAALGGCARQADMVPLNDAASATGIPKLDVALYGTGYGPAVVTMPDGEVLSGHYRLAVGGANAVGFATATGPSGSGVASGTSSVISMQNPFTLQAAGSRGTAMVCQGSAGGLGHGGAICETNRGARYQMMF